MQSLNISRCGPHGPLCFTAFCLRKKLHLWIFSTSFRDSEDLVYLFRSGMVIYWGENFLRFRYFGRLWNSGRPFREWRYKYVVKVKVERLELSTWWVRYIIQFGCAVRVRGGAGAAGARVSGWAPGAGTKWYGATIIRQTADCGSPTPSG